MATCDFVKRSGAACQKEARRGGRCPLHVSSSVWAACTNCTMRKTTSETGLCYSCSIRGHKKGAPEAIRREEASAEGVLRSAIAQEPREEIDQETRDSIFLERLLGAARLINECLEVIESDISSTKGSSPKEAAEEHKNTPVKVTGTREQVWVGEAIRTAGGLMKEDLAVGRGGKIVSKIKLEIGKALAVKTMTGKFSQERKEDETAQ